MTPINYKTTAQQLGGSTEARWFIKEHVVRIDYEARRRPAQDGSGNEMVEPMLIVTLTAGDPIIIRGAESIKDLGQKMKLSEEILRVIAPNAQGTS